MIEKTDIDIRVFEPDHIAQVIAATHQGFQQYFASFATKPLHEEFQKHIKDFSSEEKAYVSYLKIDSLEEFNHDPQAFKSHTQKNCPIIRRCLMSTDEVMKQYKKSFNQVAGRQLLTTIRKIAGFGLDYTQGFSSERHEATQTPDDLALDDLSEEEFYCPGVVGYGIQSALLFGRYPHMFARRSQNAMWSLYFLTNKQDFGLADGSEFLIIRPNEGVAEQNFLYPPKLFGFYALKIYLLLRDACKAQGITFVNTHRYIYLDLFLEHIAELHRQDISLLKWNSDYVEKYWS